jgi:hypothetical protein
MPPVQFYGVDRVMQAAENYQCAAWVIFISRAMFAKYEGTDIQESLASLQNYLDMLQENPSAGTYLIKFIESEPGKPLKITEKTVCTGGSFYFKLHSVEEREQRFIGAAQTWKGNNELSELRSEISDLKMQLQEALSAEPEPAQQETIGSVLMDAIKNPEQLMNLINVGRVLMGMEPKLAAVGSLPGAAAVPGEQDQEQLLQRLGNAIDTLQKADPQLVDHLETLAKMATDQPQKFRSLLSML